MFSESTQSSCSASSLPSPRRTPHLVPDLESEGLIELEAVISCTSDDPVVCLRKARPMMPHPSRHPSQTAGANGVFAAPWVTLPVLPPLDARTQVGSAPVAKSSADHADSRHDSTSPLPSQGTNGQLRLHIGQFANKPSSHGRSLVSMVLLPTMRRAS